MVVGRIAWQAILCPAAGRVVDSVVLDSMFHLGWKIAALPSPLDEWAAVIITSLFLVDGAKGIARTIVARKKAT